MEETKSALAALGLTDTEQAVPAFTDEPKIPAFLCYPSARATEVFPSTEEINGSGFHPDQQRARLQSVAECIERLCLRNPPRSEFTLGIPKEVARAVDPASFRVHSRTQFEDFASFERQAVESVFRWWPAVDWRTKEWGLCVHPPRNRFS